MKKFNKNLISSIFLMVILQLVAPLLAYAESGNSLRINTNYTDENSKQIVVDYVDYWKVPDGKIENIEKPEKQLELINSYKDKYDEEISKDLGEMKSSNKLEKNNGMVFALIEGLEKGVYLLRYRSNDPSRPYIPFLAIIDENTENPLTIYPKKAPDTLTLTKRDKDDTTKVLPGVGFNVINKKGEILKFNKVKDDKGNEQLTYSPNGKITEVFTDQKGQIKLFGLEEEVKFKETKPLEGYEKNVGKESEFKRSGSIELLNEKDKPENYFSFQKIDGTNNDPLKGAIFKVQEKTKDGYKDLEENGKVYTLTSGENGEFKTKNLPYGDYRLIETKAPQGYVPELDAVDFTIGETSSNKTIKVKNYKPTTPGPKGGNNRLSKRVDAMAKTGDATIYLILLLGLLMIGVGVKFVRAKE
ncbi:SpaA isopeptide-forming pilin-related protein [Anaerococcus vaginalis]|uniref:MSCRAMM family protein n=1 Tax=Anaerococcus vaginalis TaxID=33037 RepID=UPI00290B3781|nr:SpaA isopeptide-forming pilin-related protein [Anaerococcus vaginalis]MDU4447449.1 SpaA isopeptide-forming pilin-related protein [Anaerococcus vaginalis]MDU5252078.1 SpaA isopeptide-forming pilin-related protein [Anaerococcus vaginalis]MDU6781705.1 SpaA isopeptide-forming pilin-related protein [Anaerococcus vaginalis]MDU7432546.1 SpaA isopeptide-forming pilin-related protein [Anaerococcus vaginalis]